MNDRSRWLVLGALALLFFALSDTHVSIMHGGFGLFGSSRLLTAILLGLLAWFVISKWGGCSGGRSRHEASAPADDEEASTEDAQPADDEEAEDEDKSE